MQELRPWIGKPPISIPPDIPGYRLVRGENINIFRASILGILLVPVWWILFLVVVPILSGVDELNGTISIVNILTVISFILVVVVVHELLHGLAILGSGHLPSFGAGPGFFYTTCHEPLSRNAYILVVLLPLLAINLGSIAVAGIWPGAMGWALVISIMNTMGAGGDIWMFIRLLRVPRSALIVDMASGYAVYEPDQATTASPVEP
ncbi:MAG: DUF3267 domain-containing protein [Thermomicrobiales bacterium]